jgi:hypothetical protein
MDMEGAVKAGDSNKCENLLLESGKLHDTPVLSPLAQSLSYRTNIEPPT